jgi:hypothetical protein
MVVAYLLAYYIERSRKVGECGSVGRGSAVMK